MGTVLYYVCDEGYKLDTDDGSIECLLTASWSVKPDCISELYFLVYYLILICFSIVYAMYDKRKNGLATKVYNE